MEAKTVKSNMTDMTQGSPARLILFFALPLLVGNMFQQLYNMVDSIVVGRFVGSTALAAVGTAFPVVFLLSSMFMGLGIGAMVMVSQFYGAGDAERLKATIDTIYTALIVGIVPLSIVGILVSRPIIALLAVPADTADQCWIYMVIVLGGLIGSLGYNANSGILQGLGDSKTPLLFLVIACIINIVLDLLFVVVFHWGVAGVAIATIIAQAFSWIFGIFYINKNILRSTSIRSASSSTKRFSARSSSWACPPASSRRCSASASWPCSGSSTATVRRLWRASTAPTSWIPLPLCPSRALPPQPPRSLGKTSAPTGPSACTRALLPRCG